MIGLMLRSLFFISIVTTYTLSVWNLIDNYFREEFKKYLNNEQSTNSQVNRSDIANTSYKVAKSTCTVVEIFLQQVVNERIQTCSLHDEL